MLLKIYKKLILKKAYFVQSIRIVRLDPFLQNRGGPKIRVGQNIQCGCPSDSPFLLRDRGRLVFPWSYPVTAPGFKT
jgi:hypothetical protein